MSAKIKIEVVAGNMPVVVTAVYDYGFISQTKEIKVGASEELLVYNGQSLRVREMTTDEVNALPPDSRAALTE